MDADFLSGIPVAVEPGKIERELARLWKAEEKVGEKAGGKADGRERSASSSRICLSNLIVYLPEGAARAWGCSVLPEIGRCFPSRLIVLLPQAAGSGPLTASLTALCHIPAPGSPPVCCEEIVLRSIGGQTEDFPWAVLSLLVPDLPSVLLLPGREGDHLIAPLGRALDRVVFDTRSLRLGDLERLARLFDRHPALGIEDLGWRETMSWRRVLGDLFDDPGIRPHFLRMDRIEILHDARAACPAALLGGWLAARLGWQGARDGEPGLLHRGGEKLRIVLRGAAGEEPEAGASPREVPAGSIHGLRLSRCAARGGESAFLQLSHEAPQAAVRIDHHAEDSCVIPRRIPFPRPSEAALLGSILERPTRRDVFEEAVKASCLLA